MVKWYCKSYFSETPVFKPQKFENKHKIADLGHSLQRLESETANLLNACNLPNLVKTHMRSVRNQSSLIKSDQACMIYWCKNWLWNGFLPIKG